MTATTIRTPASRSLRRPPLGEGRAVGHHGPRSRRRTAEHPRTGRPTGASAFTCLAPAAASATWYPLSSWPPREQRAIPLVGAAPAGHAGGRGRRGRDSAEPPRAAGLLAGRVPRRGVRRRPDQRVTAVSSPSAAGSSARRARLGAGGSLDGRRRSSGAATSTPMSPRPRRGERRGCYERMGAEVRLADLSGHGSPGERRRAHLRPPDRRGGGRRAAGLRRACRRGLVRPGRG